MISDWGYIYCIIMGFYLRKQVNIHDRISRPVAQHEYIDSQIHATRGLPRLHKLPKGHHDIPAYLHVFKHSF